MILPTLIQIALEENAPADNRNRKQYVKQPQN